jgi:ppGpp synthetase/RelA/SpoT-type nucleotidyltranferase
MARDSLSKSQYRQIGGLVKHYVSKQETFKLLLANVQNLFSSDSLSAHVHSMKSRLKAPRRLRDKLIRKAREAKSKGQSFDITKTNLFEKINDLAGFRILHLYTRQMKDIDRVIKEILKRENYVIFEGPIAKTWDNESRQYFRSIGIETEDSDTLYTSVHYLFHASNQAKTACELQVRTLAEELWGEVDHTINYPYKAKSVACGEQIKVLARVTSSCTRLVDSIFTSHKDNQRSILRKKRR